MSQDAQTMKEVLGVSRAKLSSEVEYSLVLTAPTDRLKVTLANGVVVRLSVTGQGNANIYVGEPHTVVDAGDCLGFWSALVVPGTDA